MVAPVVLGLACLAARKLSASDAAAWRDASFRTRAQQRCLCMLSGPAVSEHPTPAARVCGSVASGCARRTVELNTTCGIRLKPAKTKRLELHWHHPTWCACPCPSCYSSKLPSPLDSKAWPHAARVLTTRPTLPAFSFECPHSDIFTVLASVLLLMCASHVQKSWVAVGRFQRELECRTISPRRPMRCGYHRGLLLSGGAQLAVDATLVSSVSAACLPRKAGTFGNDLNFQASRHDERRIEAFAMVCRCREARNLHQLAVDNYVCLILSRHLFLPVCPSAGVAAPLWRNHAGCPGAACSVTAGGWQRRGSKGRATCRLRQCCCAVHD